MKDSIRVHLRTITDAPLIDVQCSRMVRRVRTAAQRRTFGQAPPVAIAASLRLDLLDLCGHRFTKSIRCLQYDRVDDSVEVFLHHRCGANHRFDSAGLRPADPFVPRTRGAQHRVDQLRQQQSPQSLSLLGLLKPDTLRHCARRIALLKKFAMSFRAHGMHRIAKRILHAKAMRKPCESDVTAT